MLSKRRFFALSLVLLLSLSAPLSQVFAQEGSEQQDPAAPAAQEATQEQSETQRLESLVETLKDSAARQELIGQIEALIEAKEQAEGAPQESAADPSAEEAGNRLLARVSNRVDAVAKQLAEAAGVVLKLPEVATQAWEAARDAEIRQSLMEIAGKVLGVLLAAGVVQWLVMKALTRPRQGLESRAHDGVLVRLLLLFLRALLMLLPLAAFAAVAYGALPLIEPRRITRLVTLALVNAHILASVATIAGDFVMAPRAPGLRLPRIGDETAYYLR
ncbi:MAG: hypothetical protein R3316_01730, partial [Rhodovibrionaceae bacterium]|nr:hypothetical protein [Rhodovibrionaceae bacterium]